MPIQRAKPSDEYWLDRGPNYGVIASACEKYSGYVECCYRQYGLPDTVKHRGYEYEALIQGQYHEWFV